MKTISYPVICDGTQGVCIRAAAVIEPGARRSIAAWAAVGAAKGFAVSVAAIALATGALVSPAQAQTGAYTLNGGTASQSDQTYSASNTDESGVYVLKGGKLTVINPTVITSGKTSSGDNSSFYGLNAGALAASGSTLNIYGGTVTTSGTGANGVFSTGSGTVVTLSNVTIVCTGQLGHGVDATMGGTLYLTDVDIATGPGANSAAIATDRGGGTIVVQGGVVTTSGADAPGIYSTGNITINGATITATASEGAVIEGSNSITLTNTALTGAKGNRDRGIMIYQSMSGDAQGKEGVFTMTGGSFTWPSKSGPAIYVTNTKSEVTLRNVAITNNSGILLKAAADQWGTSGKNGGTAILTANGENLEGGMISDSVSSITATLQENTTLTGYINSANLTIDATSAWMVSSNSVLTSLTTAGTITGAGMVTANTVTLQGGTIDAVLAGTGSVTKSTTGKAVLSGAQTYTGQTTVSGGTLEVQGSLASAEVSVASGAVLGGAGTLAGNLTVESGGSLILSATGNLEVSGKVTFGSNLTVVPASSSLADGTYRLLAYGGGLSGLPVFIYAAAGDSKQTAVFSTNASGVITVTLSGGSAASAQLGFTWSGDQLVCNWPSNCLGWTLQAQTNSTGSGLGTHWVTIPDSALTNVMSLPIDTSVGSVFYRLIAP